MAKHKKKRGTASNSRTKRIKSVIQGGTAAIRQKAIRTAVSAISGSTGDATSVRRIQRSAPPVKNTRDKQQTKPTFDIGKGRLVYPQKGDDGKVSYLPRESAATNDEIKKGLFIREDKKAAQEIAQGLKRKLDVGKGRFVYPVKDANGKVSYVPRESEASKTEIANGQFIKNVEVVQKVAENLKAKYDVSRGRYVFPVETANKKIEYLPKAADATKFELSNGLFVKNEDVKDLEPKVERRIRRVRPKSAVKPEPPATDDQGRRNLASRPIPVAKDGTQLWDLREIPSPGQDKERELLKTLKPKYDIGKKRMIYPAQTDEGKMIYLPLKDEASKEEIRNGAYADFAPPEGLQKFITDHSLQKETETDAGKIRAVAADELESALNALPRLILKPHKSIIENVLSLHQEWV